MPDGLLTREQAAARLGVSVRTLFNLRASGYIPDAAVVTPPTERQRVLFDPTVLDALPDLRTVRANQAHARSQRRRWAGLEPSYHPDSEATPDVVERDPRTGRRLS